MVSKKYVCDYCQVRIQNNPQIIKKHNEGLQHQKCKTDHYEKYKSLKEILVTEKAKIPCKRAATNSCTFGTFCRFSHYSQMELFLLEEKCKEIDRKENQPEMDQKSIENFLDECQRNKISSGFKHKLYLENSESFLPPSLRVWDMIQTNLEDLGKNEWG